MVFSDTNTNIEISFFQGGNAGLSTADPTIAEGHISKGEMCETQSIKAFNLTTILSTHLPLNQDIDFSKIDVEGFEDSVLRGADFWTYRPKIILVESTAPLSQETTWQN